ncbi:MAG: hypothetical protein JWM10_2395 [Myxococcaceae bacterium]|nr:hypothetical protein [Myxococcaceae bacterium]
MTLTVTVCAEDSLAADTSTRLLDRVVAARASAEWLRDYWTDPSLREHQRSVVDLAGRAGWSRPAHVKQVEVRPHLRAHGRHPGTNRPLVGNAALAYKSVRVAAARPVESPHALLLAFDTDHRPADQRCRAGVEAALLGATPDLAVLVAEAHPEFDAWIIAGFVPTARHHHDAVASVRAGLRAAGHVFDPVVEPHRLTSDVAGDPRDAKKLCALLLGLDDQAHFGHAEVQRCAESIPLDTPAAEAIGVAAFVADVVRSVLPRLGDRPPSKT